MAHLLREAAEEVLRREADFVDPLADLIGSASDGPPDLATNHDEYLYGAARKRR